MKRIKLEVPVANWGAGYYGRERTPDCGCLVTHLARRLGVYRDRRLPNSRKPPYERGELAEALLAERGERPRSETVYETIARLKAIEWAQDDAANTLHGFWSNENKNENKADARLAMKEALRIMRLIGVDVRWIE